MKVIIRCKATGVYYQTPMGCHNGFTTRDITKASRYDDSPEFRERFLNNYPFAIEFISVPILERDGRDR